MPVGLTHLFWEAAMSVIEIEVSQMIVFRQNDSKSNPQGLYASDYIQFTDFARNYKQFVSASSLFNVGHRVDVHRSIVHLSVGDLFQIFDSGHKSAGQQDVVQWINFGSLALLVEYEVVTHQLSITQAVRVDVCSAAFHTLSIAQTVGLRVIRGRAITQVLVVHSGGVCVIEDDETYSIVLPTLTGPNAPTC